MVWERRYGRINYVVELVGRLDQTTSEQLDAALERALEASARRILLDLRSLSGMDLWGLDPILLAHLRASDQHVQFLIAASPTVKHVLDSICAPFDYV